MRRERLPRARTAHVLIEINGKRQPDQPYEAERSQLAAERFQTHSHDEARRPSVFTRLRPDASRLLSGREQSLENVRKF